MTVQVPKGRQRDLMIASSIAGDALVELSERRPGDDLLYAMLWDLTRVLDELVKTDEEETS